MSTKMEKDKEQEDEKSLRNNNEEKGSYPVDHGWAWMVMLGSFGMHVFTVGGLKSFGVLFQDFQIKFSASSSQIAGVYSLSSFLMFAMGPFANAMANRYSYRIVVIIGGILIALGFLLTSFVPSLWLFYLSYGLIAGIGIGLSYSPFIVMVGHHFDKRRSLAIGLSVSGSGFGSFILPNIIRSMMHIYHLNGMMLILAGAMMHVCVCGSLIRPLEYYRRRKKSSALSGKPTHENMEALLGQTDNPDKSTENHVLENESKMFRRGSRRINKLMQADSTTSSSPTDMVIVRAEESANNDKSAGDESKCVRIGRIFNCIKNEDGNRENNANACFDCSLLFDPVFLVYGFTLLFGSFGYMNIFIIIPSHAENLGMTDSEGAFLVSLTGLADIFGRLFFGWFADLKLIPHKYLFFLSLFLCSASIGLIPFLYSYWGLAVLCCLTGVFAGSYIATAPAVLVEVLGLEKLSSSLGLGFLFVSAGMLLGPPAVGWIRDASNRQWRNSLFFCAFMNFLGSSLILLELLSTRYKERERKKLEVEDKTNNIS